MVNQKITITDEELISKIVSSQLEENQKTELTNIVKEMTQEERTELIGLIREANESAQMTKEEEEKLIAINEKYEEKLNVAAREESNYVRNEFEKFDKEQSAGEFKEVEAKLENGIAEPQSGPPLSKQMGRPEVMKKERSAVRTAVTIAVIVVATIITLAVLISIL